MSDTSVIFSIFAKNKTGDALKAVERDFSETTDKMATKSSIMMGAMGALGSGFELFGVESSPVLSALQSFGLVFDTVSGVMDIATIALEAHKGAQEADNAVTIVSIAQQKIAAAGTKLWAGAQWLLNGALDANPIALLVIAIAGLVTAIVLIATKTDWFQKAWHATWGLIGKPVKALWNWIKGNWPYLLGILTGPVGLAVVWIIKHWDSVVSFFTGMPGKIRKIASSMWDGIRDSFKNAINWMINGWNNLSFTIPSVGFGPFHTPSFTLNTPNIPLLARGGIIKARPGGTLAVIGEAGQDEKVVPLPRGGGGEGGGRLDIEMHAADGDTLAELIMALLRPVIRGKYNGDVTFALGGRT